MPNLTTLKTANAKRWANARISPNLIHFIAGVAQHLVSAKARYQTVSDKTTVPWFVIAVIHERESSQSWLGSLAQGDPWNKPSIHKPHRPAFPSWEAAAEDALVVCNPHAASWKDWSVGGSLTLLEQFNGLGYANMGRPSPYIWASTDQYKSGKFVADGHYDPNAVDTQIGCAALLRSMMTIDPTIEFVA